MDIKTLKLLFIGMISLGLLLIGIGAFNIYSSMDKTKSPKQDTPTEEKNQNTSGQSVKVKPTILWNNTGVELNKGDKVSIKSSGQINIGTEGDGADKWINADGWGYMPEFAKRYKYPVSDSLGALIGKVGNEGKALYIGTSKSFTASKKGTLYLGVNDGISDGTGKLLSESDLIDQMYSNNRGSFTSIIQIINSSERTKGTISVKKLWTSVGKFQGNIKITMSGTAILDNPPIQTSPNGIDTLAPPFFVLPNERAFCSLIRFNGKIEKVGLSKEINLPNETEIFLGVNEDSGKQGGVGLEDNSGSWSYEIRSK